MSLTLSAILIMVVILIYSILVNIFTVLFRITGLTKEKASFQVVSLLTACGFTTTESEIITSSQVRRRIAKAAMLTGYAFSVIIVSLIMNLLININKELQREAIEAILIAFVIFILFFILKRLPFIKGPSEELISRIAKHFLTKGKCDNIITLLDLYSDDAICEVYLNNLPEFLVDKPLYECKLKDKYSMNIMIVKRRNKVIDVTKDTILQRKDSVVIFGDYQNIKDVFSNPGENLDAITDVVKRNEIELIDNYGTDAMARIKVYNVPSFLQNVGLYESGLKDKYSINVIMLQRDTNVVEVVGSTIIEENDEIVVFGPYSNIKEIFKEKQS